MITPPKLHFSSILETKLHRSPQGSHLFIKTKNATVYSFKIFLNGKGRILLPAVTILVPAIAILVAAVTILLSVVMILLPAVTIFLPVIMILVPEVKILLSVVMILVAAVTILPCPFRIFHYSLKMFLKSTLILVQKKTLQSKLKSFSGESRIRTCEVYTADLQSALVGRLSISPRLNK